MSVVGWGALALVGIIIIGGVLFAVTAVPDYNRYRRLRKM